MPATRPPDSRSCSTASQPVTPLDYHPTSTTDHHRRHPHYSTGCGVAVEGGDLGCLLGSRSVDLFIYFALDWNASCVDEDAACTVATPHTSTHRHTPPRTATQPHGCNASVPHGVSMRSTSGGKPFPATSPPAPALANSTTQGLVQLQSFESTWVGYYTAVGSLPPQFQNNNKTRQPRVFGATALGFQAAPGACPTRPRLHPRVVRCMVP